MGGFDRDYSALCASPSAMLRAALSGVLQRVASQSGRRAGVTLWAAVAGRGQEPEWLDQTMDTSPFGRRPLSRLRDARGDESRQCRPLGMRAAGTDSVR